MASKPLATRSAIMAVLACAVSAVGLMLMAPRHQAAAQSRGGFGSFFGFFGSGDERFAPPDVNRSPAYAPPSLPVHPRTVRRRLLRHDSSGHDSSAHDSSRHDSSRR